MRSNMLQICSVIFVRPLWFADASVYGPEVKRRKTEEEKKAEKERKLEREALAASADPTAEWSIGQRQPWAEKQVQPARPTEEQLAWLKEEGFIKEEDEEGEKVTHAPCCCSDLLPTPLFLPQKILP